MIQIIVDLNQLKDALKYLEEGGMTTGFIEIIQAGKREIQINEYSFDQGILNSGVFVPTYGD